jgi:hypothetical protein
VNNEERPAYSTQTQREPPAYRNEPAPQQSRSYREPDYSIAFRDHRIIHAIAYWTIDGTLHYVTRDHAMHEVPLTQIDRLFTEQLNRDKGVDFRLPSNSPSVPAPTQQ